MASLESSGLAIGRRAWPPESSCFSSKNPAVAVVVDFATAMFARPNNRQDISGATNALEELRPEIVLRDAHNTRPRAPPPSP